MSAHSQTEGEAIVARAFGTMALLLLAICMAIAGCEKRERVLDVEAPGVDIEIDKTTSPDGSTTIEVKK